MAILINMTSRNSRMNDSSLSWKARGIFSYLAAREWNFNFKFIEDLIKQAKDNQRSVYSGVNELKAAEYLHSFPCKRSRFESYIYIIFDEPTQLKDEQKHAISDIILNGVKAENAYAQYRTSHTTNTLVSTYINNIISINNNSSKGGMPKKNKKEIDALINFWQGHLKKHKETSKTFWKGCKRLERKYEHLNAVHIEIKPRNKEGRKKIKTHSHGYKTILAAMEVYHDALGSFEKKFPFYVGLDEFFGFNDYSKNHLFKNLRGKAVNVTTMASWYAECLNGAAVLAAKWNIDKNPVVTKLIADYVGSMDVKNAKLIRAAAAYCEFFNTHRKQIETPNKLDAHYPERFLKYLFKFIEQKFTARKFKPYILLNADFLKIDFKDWLQEMGWLTK